MQAGGGIQAARGLIGGKTRAPGPKQNDASPGGGQYCSQNHGDCQLYADRQDNDQTNQNPHRPGRPAPQKNIRQYSFADRVKGVEQPLQLGRAVLPGEILAQRRLFLMVLDWMAGKNPTPELLEGREEGRHGNMSGCRQSHLLSKEHRKPPPRVRLKLLLLPIYLKIRAFQTKSTANDGGFPSARPGRNQSIAISSISTRTLRGRREASIVERAGGLFTK